MSEPVIDSFEPVKIDEQQRQLFMLANRLNHRLLKPVPQQAAIGQPGKLVVKREVVRLRA